MAISLMPVSDLRRRAGWSNTLRSAEAVWRALLTELESTAIQAVSAQSPATGKSAERARKQIAQAAAVDITNQNFRGRTH